MYKRLLVGLVLVLLGPRALAAGSAEVITSGPRRAPGVKAVARTYSAPVAQGPSSEARVAGVRVYRGPVLEPLAAQVFCGHDPRYPGGQICIVPPPPKPEMVDTPRRRRPPTPDEVARRLADRAISLAPRPRLRFAPGRRGMTGLPSYFWLAERPRPIQAQAGVAGTLVTAQAWPVQYVWTYGDGTDRVTRRPGRAWTRRRAGTIAHTYEGRGRYTVEVEVIWQARWRLGSGAWRSLGYFSNSATRGYRVRSMVAVLVKPR